MTNQTARFAVATLAAITPLATVTLVTAAPSMADCEAGQSSFNGNCVASSCKKSEVRDAGTGACRNALSAALGKAQAPAVAQVSPQQWSDAYRVVQQSGGLPSGISATKDVFSVVNSAIDIPTSIASGVSDTADALSFLSDLVGSSTSSSATSAAASVGGAVRTLTSVHMPKLFSVCLPVKLASFRPCI